MGKKTLEELVFHDDFMFAAVMMDAENCRCFLERVLEIKIEKVEISTEHGFFFNNILQEFSHPLQVVR